MTFFDKNKSNWIKTFQMDKKEDYYSNMIYVIC